MRMSVVVNVHAGTNFSQFREAADSVLAQDHKDFELIVVTADAPDIRARIEDRYADHPAVRTVILDIDEGLSAARNAGAEASTGEVVVFTDDDVVTDPSWLSSLVEVYENENPVGVGGHVNPIWPEDIPWHLPAEFYWLVGVVHKGFVDERRTQRVRNTFGCNISFDRDTFLAAGGFRDDLGKNQKNPLQGEEAELCARIGGEFWYTPDAIVQHRVDDDQLSLRYLTRRSFWQGYSKAALTKDTGEESLFLRQLFLQSIPQRIRSPSFSSIGQVVMLLSLTISVGLGFLYAKVRARVSSPIN